MAASTARALEPPPKPESYVNDYAGMLSAGAKAEIERELVEFEKATSNQILVATFASLEGDSLEDFSIRLAERWKIGQKDKDNGVILLVFRDDRAVRIEVGYGLEGALPDVLCDAIIRNEIVPAFREGSYGTGIHRAVRAIEQATKGEYSADQNERGEPGMIVGFLLGAFFIFPPLSYLFALALGMILLPPPAGFFLGLGMAAALMGLRAVLFQSVFGQTFSERGWRSGGFGGGGFGSGGFGGGGFGGGGGGSFGGGGASGRW